MALGRVRIRRYNQQDQQTLVDPTDIGFEYISKVSQDYSFTWGEQAMQFRPRPSYEDPYDGYTPDYFNP